MGRGSTACCPSEFRSQVAGGSPGWQVAESRAGDWRRYPYPYPYPYPYSAEF